MNRNAIQSLLAVVAIALGLAMLEAPTFTAKSFNTEKSLASRYPLRSRTPSFFERSKVSYNQAKKAPTTQAR